jgi:tetratricopeptide (TPR) repeat protein
VPHTSIAAVTTAALVEVARAPEEPQKLDEQVDDEVAPQPARVGGSAAGGASRTPDVDAVKAVAEVASALPTPVPVAMPTEMTADQAKEAARAALEHGANRAAISAGERAVVMDGSDAEAWLVLGAAYQANGNVGHAKSCYDACVSHGSKGPVDECRDMLRTL